MFLLCQRSFGHFLQAFAPGLHTKCPDSEEHNDVHHDDHTQQAEGVPGTEDTATYIGHETRANQCNHDGCTCPKGADSGWIEFGSIEPGGGIEQDEHKLEQGVAIGALYSASVCLDPRYSVGSFVDQ